MNINKINVCGITTPIDVKNNDAYSSFGDKEDAEEEHTQPNVEEAEEDSVE